MNSIFKNKGTKGFTLIELLVVIAIIALLSAVVLVSLNNARSKGDNGKVKSTLSSMRTQSALIYENSGVTKSFDNLCTDSGILAASSSLAKSVNYLGCTGGGQTFSILAVFKTSDGTGKSAWCVDSGGYSGYSASTTVTAGALCK
jgi:prepilin-type N-terminal cleavage/methylation domain-containing protein